LNIKVAIFDMDGTLVDSLMLWDVLWSTFGERYLNDKSFAPSLEDDKKSTHTYIERRNAFNSQELQPW